MEPADEVGREGREQGKEEEGRRETEQNKKIGYVGKGGGVAVWRFQFLPFARKATPVFACQYLAIKKVIHKAIFFQKRLDSLPRLLYNITVNNEPHNRHKPRGGIQARQRAAAALIET